MERNLAVDGTLRIATLVITLNHRQGRISHMECTNAHKRHTITHIHITYTGIHTCTHTHYVNTNLKVLADVHDHCT